MSIERLEPRRLFAVTLEYSSFFGGGGIDNPTDIVNLPSGDLIAFGSTTSADLTTTAGGEGTFAGGTSDAFVARFARSGSLMWSTYLGGDGDDNVMTNHVHVDDAGDLIVSGTTRSTDFPTTSGLDQTLGGTNDGFITRLNLDTGAIMWSRYFGGSGDDLSLEALPSPTGEWYVRGLTGSADLPTPNGFDTTYGGGDVVGSYGTTGDAFVGRIDPDDGQTLFCSYVGGSAFEPGLANGNSFDPQGNFYTDVLTQSTDLPIVGGFDSPNPGGQDDYVIKIDGSGNRLWSARVGGSLDDNSILEVSDAGQVVLLGFTTPPAGPASAGHDTTYGGGSSSGDGFVMLLDGNTGQRQWGSYIGGNGDDTVNEAWVQDGHLYAGVHIGSTDVPAIGGFDTDNPAGNDTLVLKYALDGELIWSTYLGGGGSVDASISRGLNFDGSIYAVGSTADPAFSAVGGFDTTYNGGGFFGGDAVVVRIGADGQRQWSTFVGGSNGELFAFADGGVFDDAGHQPNDLVLLVPTPSDDITTIDGFDPTYNGPAPSDFSFGNDALLVHLASDGTQLASSYLGGSGTDFDLRLQRADDNGDILILGQSPSADYPTTADASDATYNGPAPADPSAFDGDMVITRVAFGPRELGDAAAFATLTGGVLSVEGSVATDAITLGVAGDQIQATRGETTLSFAAAGVTDLEIDTGTFTFTGDVGDVTLQIASGASAVFYTDQHLAGLHVDGGTAGFSSGGDRVLVAQEIAFTGDGQLDVLDDSLAVHSTAANRFADAANVAANIKSGFNLGGTLWAGPGITTSLGGNGAGSYHALGTILNDLAAAGVGTGAIYSTFAGEDVGVNDVLVRYTYFGDADLDGAVTTNDYFQIDNGFLGAKTGWINGDFDYDGSITTNDYFLIDNAFLGQSSAAGAAAVDNADATARGQTAPFVAGTATLNRTVEKDDKLLQSLVEELLA
jgi:hypothetical protein